MIEWGTKIQPSVQSALLAHPEVNVVIPIYDSMSQFVVPAMRLTGRRGGEGRDLQRHAVRARLRSAGKVDMDIGESLDWIASRPSTGTFATCAACR